MTHNELCDKYIEISQQISAAHTQLRAAGDMHKIQQTAQTEQNIKEIQEHIAALQEQRAKLEKLLNITIAEPRQSRNTISTKAQE